MTLYQFSTNLGGKDPAPEQLDLPDLEAARREATRLLGHAIFDLIGDFWADGACKVIVSNPAGLILFEVHAFTMNAPATMPERVLN